MSDVRSGPRITIGDLEIELVEKVIVRVDAIGGGIMGVALKEPIAIIVRSPAGTQRLDLERSTG